MYYQDIFNALSQQKVRYLVVGAVAMNLHGVPRMTADLDIMLDLSEANLKRFIRAISGAGYKPRVPVSLNDLAIPAFRDKWASEKNMIVLSLYKPELPYQELDVFIANPVDFSEAYNRRMTCKIKGLTIPVVSVEDLILMKETAGRKQDKSDIGALKKLKNP